MSRKGNAGNANRADPKLCALIWFTALRKKGDVFITSCLNRQSSCSGFDWPSFGGVRIFHNYGFGIKGDSRTNVPRDSIEAVTDVPLRSGLELNDQMFLAMAHCFG